MKEVAMFGKSVNDKQRKAFSVLSIGRDAAS
jgi:hypothetical protein